LQTPALLSNSQAPYDPLAVDYGGMLAAPSRNHLLGTDNFGRDVFSRIIYGSQTALAVGFLSPLIGSTPGPRLRPSDPSLPLGGWGVSP